MKTFWRIVFVVYILVSMTLGVLLVQSQGTPGALLFFSGLGLLGAPWTIAALFIMPASPPDWAISGIAYLSLILNAWLLFWLGWRRAVSPRIAQASTDSSQKQVVQARLELQRIWWTSGAPFVLILFLWWIIRLLGVGDFSVYRGLFFAQLTTLLSSWLLFVKNPRTPVLVFSVVASVLVTFWVESVMQGSGRPPVFIFWWWLLLMGGLYGASLYVRTNQARRI